MAKVRAKRWVFTLNNYTEEDCEQLRRHLIDVACYFAVVGKEVGEGGTPHLQGFASFKTFKYFTAVKRLVGEGVHLEVAKKPDAANDKYCSKGGDLLLRVGTCGGAKSTGPASTTSSPRSPRKPPSRRSWTPCTWPRLTRPATRRRTAATPTAWSAPPPLLPTSATFGPGANRGSGRRPRPWQTELWEEVQEPAGVFLIDGID